MKAAAAPHDNIDNTADETQTSALVKRLVRQYLSPHFGLLIKAFSFMIVAAAMTACVAQLMQPVLDSVLVDQDQNLIFPIAAAVFVTFLVRGIATYFHSTTMMKIGQGIVAQIQEDVFDKLMTLDLAYFHDNPSGQLISRIISDVTVMRVAVSDSVTGFGRSLFTLIFLIGVMFYQDWKLSIAAFIVFPFAALFVAYLGKKLRQVSKGVQDETADLSGMLSQIFRGVRQVKAYGMEDYERGRAGAAVRRVRDLNIKSVRIGNLSTPVNEILVGLVMFGIISYGGFQAANGLMTAGQLGAFLTAFIMAYEPMKKLARLNNSLQVGLGAAERILGILDERSSIHDKADAQDLNAEQAEIIFKDVNFSYKDNDVSALKGVDFSANYGQVTAFVGESGAGKTTILNLLPRFYDISSGDILINKTSVYNVKLKSLREKISLVSQDITIFDDTVMNNIRYGSFDASDEDVMEAAKQAHAHDFISELADGYQTILGEDGTSLSGGQRQRISIARALLRNAPILLLDEATSALDNESEKIVQDALSALEKGRTTLVVAHRLSTIQNADQILVMDKGSIVERGTHQKLLDMNGFYAKMYYKSS